MANPGKMATFTITNTVAGSPNIVESPGSDMTPDAAGTTYTGMHPLAMGTHDGTYTVTVHVGDDMMSATAMLTVDNTPPTVSDVSRLHQRVVVDGGTVTITATVTGATSVMADVSMLDSEAEPYSVTLTAGEGTAPDQCMMNGRDNNDEYDNHR